jgi:hypothetical protein
VECENFRCEVVDALAEFFEACHNEHVVGNIHTSQREVEGCKEMALNVT